MKIKLLTLATLLTTTAFAVDLAPKSYDLKAVYNYSKISGFVQIPKGGQDGTTSLRRPTFDEMGIKKIHSPEIQLQANWDNFSGYANFHYMKFDGTATLNEDLISHSKLIPKGSQFKTDHKYQNYTAGFKYNLYSNETLSVHPLMELSIYNFKYKYNATTPNNATISSGRSFNWGQINLGFQVVVPVTEKYTVETNFKYGMTNKVRQYLNLGLTNKYTVFSNNNQKLDLVCGINASKLEFRDRQKERQNHIVHKIKPNVFAGIEYSF